MSEHDITHIGQLKPDPANARRHNPRNIGMVERSLNEVGAARSIVIDEGGTILAGNGVVEAAALAGIERVQVVDADGETIVAVRRTGLSDAQKRRLALYDNRTAELAEWDEEEIARIRATDSKLLDGLFTDEELTKLLRGVTHASDGADAAPEEDEADALQAKWETAPGQLWEVPSLTVPGRSHRLLCGDSTKPEDVARLLAGATPTLTITDPPYGVDYDPAWRQEAAAAGHLAYAASRVGQVVNDDRTDWYDAWALCPGPIIYCWHADRHASSVQASLERAGFEIRCQVIWSKPHFPISRGHYHWRHEPCWYAVRKGETAHWIGDHKQTTVWDDITLDPNVEGGHSAQKPLECMARPIRNHEGDVYDPFLGTGTTIVAAEDLGRIAYGCDISPAYLAVTLQRLTRLGLTPSLTGQVGTGKWVA